MENLFDDQEVIVGKENVTYARHLNTQELDMVISAKVIEWCGIKLCRFMIKSGKFKDIPISNMSSVAVGDSLDLSKIKVCIIKRSINKYCIHYESDLPL